MKVELQSSQFLISEIFSVTAAEFNSPHETFYVSPGCRDYQSPSRWENPLKKEAAAKKELKPTLVQL